VTGCLGAKGDVVKNAHPKYCDYRPHATDEVMEVVHQHLPNRTTLYDLCRHRAYASRQTFCLPENFEAATIVYLLHYSLVARDLVSARWVR